MHHPRVHEINLMNLECFTVTFPALQWLNRDLPGVSKLKLQYHGETTVLHLKLWQPSHVPRPGYEPGPIDVWEDTLCYFCTSLSIMYVKSSTQVILISYIQYHCPVIIKNRDS